MNSETRQCQNCKQNFVIEPEDFEFYEKIKVPPPTWCPDCRLQRRLAFRNERMLYKRPCGLCGASTISMYDPEGPIQSYCGPCWWSDKWNPLDCGQEYDFSKPFFVQFRALMEKVPHQNLSVSYKTLLNSEFTNMNHELKNCYWLFNADYDENCLYSEEVEHSKDCIDTTMIESGELIYQSLNCNKCYRTYYSVDCEGSHDVWFSKNLVGCSNCFGCVNLRNQQYRIFNEPYTKEDYTKKIDEFNLGSFTNMQELKRTAKETWLKYPNKYIHGLQNVKTTGDYIYNSRHVSNSFIVRGSEYCKYCMWLIVNGNKECYDFTQFGENAELVYESLVCGKGVNRVIGSVSTLESHDMSYCLYCFSNNSNLFGCIGLRNKQYCILNKQYTKEEYEKLISKIISQMNTSPYEDEGGRKHFYGDFFPTQISPFAYNETSAQEFFPLDNRSAQQAGYFWKETKARDYNIAIHHDELPNHIREASEDLVGKIIGCAHEGKCNEQCTTAFRVTPYELQFYKSSNIPLPRTCPNCRHYERVENRNPIKLWKRQCQCAGAKSTNGIYSNTVEHFHKSDHCPNEFETSYSPERPEIVYCETCYQNEVV